MSGPLDEYRKKRDFGRTSEPAPRVPGGAHCEAFVVHRHEARRLHYDLRLAMNGVLVSWAVPKGFSYQPRDKRLAVRTEDHPIEYETFEGMIPRGEYGAGTMTIWDHGSYRLLHGDDPAAAVARGELKLEMFGRRLRGEWHLVRTKENWLLFKARDRHAASDNAAPLSMDLTRARSAPLPVRVRPMMATATSEPFSDPAWVFEMEFAGARMLVRKQGESIAFIGAPRRKLAERLPGLVADLAAVRADSAMIDGVLVAVDSQGRPQRELLATVLDGGGEAPLLFYAFDLLHFDGWDLRRLSLLDRKAALAAILVARPSVMFVDHVVGGGEELARSVAAAGLAGVVAKRAASPYRSGPRDDWRACPVEPSNDDAGVPVEQALRRRRSPARVASSNAGKVYWPQEGFTKGDLLVFYQQVTDVLLPYLKDRPVHLYRWPDGIEGESFYQQSAPAGHPNWLVTERIQRVHKAQPIDQIICNDRDTLLYLINLGSIDIHPWMSRRGSLDSPDYTVIDLDPKGAPFRDVVKVAREVGKLLRGIGLRPLLKTSGASGLHIHVPLRAGYTYAQSRMFSETVARVVAKEFSDIATVERAIAQRRGRVYVDFGQNRRGQTVVPPYTARPVPGATVSTPLEWDELTGDLHPSLFTIRSMPARLAERGDLFRPLLEDRQDLQAPIAALQEWLR